MRLNPGCQSNLSITILNITRKLHLSMNFNTEKEVFAGGKKTYQMFLYAIVGHPYGIFVRSSGMGVALRIY